jgi:hypothetical protein
MEITVWTVGHIIIYDNVDTFNINSSAENVCCNANSLVEVFEGFVPCNTNWSEHAGNSEIPFLLWKSSMDGDTREIAFP